MQTITKQWICKTAEMKWLFLEQFAIKLANSACVAVYNFAFWVLNKNSSKVYNRVLVKGRKGRYSENTAFRKWVNEWALFLRL